MTTIFVDAERGKRGAPGTFEEPIDPPSVYERLGALGPGEHHEAFVFAGRVQGYRLRATFKGTLELRGVTEIIGSARILGVRASFLGTMLAVEGAPLPREDEMVRLRLGADSSYPGYVSWVRSRFSPTIARCANFAGSKLNEVMPMPGDTLVLERIRADLKQMDLTLPKGLGLLIADLALGDSVVRYPKGAEVPRLFGCATYAKGLSAEPY